MPPTQDPLPPLPATSGSTPIAPPPAPSPDTHPARLGAPPYLLPFLLLLVAAAAAFLPALDGPFLFDDGFMIGANSAVQSGSQAAAVFLRADPARGYRPLQSALLWAEQQAFGDDPRGFHVVGILLHALVALLLYLLLRRLFPRSPACLAATLLFAVHPATSEVACSISMGVYALSGALALTAWILALHPGRAAFPLALLAWLLALLAHEQSGVLPIAYFLSELVIGRTADGSVPRRAWVRTAGFLLALAGYFLLRSFALGYVGTPIRHYFADVSWPIILLTQARFAVFHYLPGLLCNARLVPLHSRPAFPDATLDQASAWVCLALLAAGGGVALVRLWSRRSGAGLGLATCAAFLLPPSSLFLRTYTLGAQRYAYLPALGLAIAAVPAFQFLLTASAPGRRRARALAIVLLLAAYAAAASGSAALWRNPPALHRRIVEANPGVPTPLCDLAAVLRAAGRPAEALACYAAAAEAIPDAVERRTFLARTRMDFGDTPQARKLLAEALDLLANRTPTAETRRLAARTHALLATACLDPAGQDLAAAERAARAAGAADPENPGAWSTLGAVLDLAGHPAEAAAAYRRAVDLDPLELAAAYDLGVALQRSGRPRAAEDAFREAIRRAPSFAQPRLALGRLLMQDGRVDEGRRHLLVYLDCAAREASPPPAAAEVARRLGVPLPPPHVRAETAPLFPDAPLLSAVLAALVTAACAVVALRWEPGNPGPETR
ncbi:MAG: glycosyltransferase family 39 protein [Planctomycetes bacterium]|nr:glycosyltransferase family 39 protein [Planctomycetota bacterium]